MTKQINKQDMCFELELEFVPIRGENVEFSLKNEVVLGFPRTPEFDRAWMEFQKRKAISKGKKRS